MKTRRVLLHAALAQAILILLALLLPGEASSSPLEVTSREVWRQALAFAPSGRLTVAWSGPDTTGQPGLFARHFERTGAPRGSEMRVGYGRPDWGAISVVPLAEDGFAVAWTIPGEGLTFRRFDADGIPLGAGDLVVPAADPGGLIHPLPSGGFLAVWTSAAEGGGRWLNARRYSAAGEPAGRDMTLARFNAEEAFDAVAVGPGDSLLVTWKAAAGSFCRTLARRFGTDGLPLANPFWICGATGGASAPPLVAAGPGGFVAVWSGLHGIYMRRYGLSGTPLGGTSRVDTEYDWGGAYPTSSLRMASSPAGALVVLWQTRTCKEECSELGEGDVIVWRVYAPNGTPWSAALNRYSSYSYCPPGEGEPALAAGPDEFFAATWRRVCGADEEFDLQGGIFSVGPPAPPPPPPPPPRGGTLKFAETVYGVRSDQPSVMLHVQRSGGSGRVSVDYQTLPESARPGVDYVPVSGTLVWLDGAFGARTLTVPILQGAGAQRQLRVVLSNPTAAAAASGSATVVIDSPGSLVFVSPHSTVLENAGSVTLQVERRGGTRGDVSVRYAAGPPPDSDGPFGDATYGEDFQPVTGTLRWRDGDGSLRSIVVPILDDDQVEDWEGFVYSLFEPTGASFSYPSWAWVTIEDDELSLASHGRLELSGVPPAPSVGEGAGRALIQVRRLGGMGGRVSVRYSATAGTATAGVDFAPVSGVLVWSDADLDVKTFEVPILDDGAPEAAETVQIALSAASGGAVLGEASATRLTIWDDDAPPDPGRPLTAAEVACDGARLAGMLGRLSVARPQSPQGSINLTLTASGDFAGVAHDSEMQWLLTFSTNLEESPLLRDPRRPLLPAVSLTRNPLASDLVAAESPDVLRVALNPTSDATPAPAALLTIDNVAGSGGVSSDAKAGRGLRPLLSLCHPPLPARDAHVLHLLTRLLRGTFSTGIAIYRGESPDTYRVDVGPSGDRLAVLLTVPFDASGALSRGSMVLLPDCTSGQTTGCTDAASYNTLLLTKPSLPGRPPELTLYYVSHWVRSVDVDWTALLAGTTWLRPL